MKKEHHQLTLLDRLISGSFSGAVLISVTYPLDLTVARLSTGVYSGIFHCLSETFKNEGKIQQIYHSINIQLILTFQ